MSESYTGTLTLTSINCGECGGTYAINERYRRSCEEKGRCWHCPYCDCSWGYSEGENAKLKKQLAAKEKEIADEKARVAREKARHDQTKTELRETERRRRAQKGITTRLKNRIKAGTCPCCDEQFANLHAHMAEAHPDFVGPDDTDEVAGQGEGEQPAVSEPEVAAKE